MKRVFLYLGAACLFSTVPILILFSEYYHKSQKITYNFQRNIDYGIYDIKRFDLKYNTYYIAGQSGTDLYLGNSTTRPQLLKINSLLTDTQSQVIEIDKAYLKTKGVYDIKIDSDQFYLFNGLTRTILKGKVGIWKASADPVFIPYFQQSVPIGSNSIAFQYVSAKTKNNSLLKGLKPFNRIENEHILEKQVDGLFCTSGTLEYNHQLGQLTYLYAYRNQILLIDTNLNLIKKVKTIDPVDRARFKVSTINSDNSKVITSPSTLVNAKCSSWKKYLFVQSKLMGKHEDQVRFKNSVVLDIYDLEKYSYVYSLYLPNQDKDPISQFKVIGDYIYTLSDHFITRYTVKLPAN